MPEGAVYVGRPTKWGNPFPFSMGRHWAVDSYRAEFRNRFGSFALQELRGKDLACWCPLDQPCHADVLLEWANRGLEESK